MRKISPVKVKDQEDDGSNDQLEHDPSFLQRIEESRREIDEGRGVRLEDVEEEMSPENVDLMSLCGVLKPRVKGVTVEDMKEAATPSSKSWGS